jgi:hypothetical protein
VALVDQLGQVLLVEVVARVAEAAVRLQLLQDTRTKDVGEAYPELNTPTNPEPNTHIHGE